MVLTASLTLLALSVLQLTSAKRVHFTGISNAGSSQGSVDLGTSKDLIYIANVTIDGKQYPVQLDTGSSDLWVYNPASPVVHAKFSQLELNLTYGIGWAYGTVASAPVSFAGFDIPDQAFLNVTSSVNPLFQHGAVGILGLGFTSLSKIDGLVNSTLSSTINGRSLLYNAFVQYPQEPNYIAFHLQRTSNPNVATEGSFTIGEVEPGFEAVMNQPSIPTWPVNNPTRWNVLIDGYSINGGKQKQLTSGVLDAPIGRSVTLLDSGTSYIYAPETLVTEIYAGIKGAQFDNTNGLWILPCDTEIHVSFFIGGQEYPLHPLDAVLSVGAAGDGCIGTFVPQLASIGNSEFDILAGDAFLRSVYSVYDFGDFVNANTKEMGPPYVKLLGLVNAANASAEFHSIRGGTGSTLNAGAGNSTSIFTPTLNDIYNTVDKVLKYAPIAIGLIALNALLLCVLCGVGVALLIKRKPRGSTPPPPTVVGGGPPIHARGGNTESTVFLTGSRGSYQPVSMNLDGSYPYEQPKYNP